MQKTRDAAFAGSRRSTPIHVFVAGGECPLVCDGVGALIAREPGWRVSLLGEPAGRSPSGRTVPGVALVVAAPPGQVSMELVSSLSRQQPPRPALALSTVDDPRFVADLLGHGARGCLAISSTTQDLLRALRDVAAGRAYLDRSFAADEMERRVRAQRADEDAYASLTPREREVLQLVAGGLTNDDVALRLAVSRRTVEAHRAHVMNKLRLRGSIDLLRYALRRGVVSLE